MSYGRCGRPTASMVAYAIYATDARIKNYVHALTARGWEVDVYALGDVPQEGEPGVRFIPVGRKYVGDSTARYIIACLAFFLRVAALLALAQPRRRYRLVHAHNMPDFLALAALAPKLAGARVILDIHDTMPEAYATKGELSLGHPLIRLLRWQERLSGAFADRLIATHDLHKEVLVARGHPAAKIAIIMNVGDERIFGRRPARGEVPGDGRLTLAYHGTVARRLGIDLILRGLALARAQGPARDLRLLLIGDGEFMPEVRRLIADLALEDIVTLVGWVPVERLPAYLAEADVGVVGNRGYTEARRNFMLPVKMLEYAALGIPTIAPRLATIARYFDDRAALLYRPDDVRDLARRIGEVSADRGRLAALAPGLDDFNRRFNWAAMERRYCGLLAEMGCEMGCEVGCGDGPG